METTPAPAPEATSTEGGMHAELSLVDAAAFSVGLIGPVGAIALLGTGAAAIIGKGVTLSFVFASVGIALVAYCFIKLSQHMFAQARDATGKKTGLATIGAIRFLFFAGEPKEPRWQVVIPVLGCALVLYTIYRNVFIGQEGTYAHLPWIEFVYLIVGLGVVIVAPGLAGRVRVGLAASEAA